EGNSWFEVKLREGRTQQIRKMFQAVGHPVSKLRRVAIGPLSDPRLGPGDYRELTKTEVKMLVTMKEPAKPKVRRAATRPASGAKKKSTAAATKKTSAKKPARKAAAPAKRRSASTATSTRREVRRGRG
ncbi:MAG: hypothetical protein ACXW31_09115, partial [Thermoanaerobaculia bacterium]